MNGCCLISVGGDRLHRLQRRSSLAQLSPLHESRRVEPVPVRSVVCGSGGPGLRHVSTHSHTTYTFKTHTINRTDTRPTPLSHKPHNLNSTQCYNLHCGHYYLNFGFYALFPTPFISRRVYTRSPHPPPHNPTT